MNESNVNANVSTIIAPISSLFVLHGNIFDVFPVRPNEKDVNYVSLKTYITYEIFKNRSLMLFYDISDGIEKCRATFISG
jgi:hypothetical protein